MKNSPTIVADHRACYEALEVLFTASEPFFLGRIGGSDTEFACQYHKMVEQLSLQEAEAHAVENVDFVKRFNGYYDLDNKAENVSRFCDLLTDSYVSCQQMFIGGSRLLTSLIPESINPSFHITDSTAADLRSYVLNRCVQSASHTLYPYTFVEHILRGRYTLFALFSQILAGRRVLVVSPFAQSILSNFETRSKFFRSYSYPDFELLTYNTPITYLGLPEEMYPDRNWFDTLDRMQHEIGQMEFDIALLSCGSYGMPIGAHVCSVLRRKAIYVGGCLQLYFGIMGRRYKDIHFTDQINVDRFISPLESDKYMRHVKIYNETAAEAFAAYF